LTTRTWFHERQCRGVVASGEAPYLAPRRRAAVPNVLAKPTLRVALIAVRRGRSHTAGIPQWHARFRSYTSRLSQDALGVCGTGFGRDRALRSGVMSRVTSNCLTVQGHVSPGFEHVRETFAENFVRRHELGGACTAYCIRRTSRPARAAGPGPVGAGDGSSHASMGTAGFMTNASRVRCSSRSAS
jgi:hypothetical protein